MKTEMETTCVADHHTNGQSWKNNCAQCEIERLRVIEAAA